MAKFRDKGDQHTALPDGATIVIVGGGPAGAFFAIRMLRGARELGKQAHLLVLEQKEEVHICEPMSPATAWEGCNYCAGGISPRLADVLRENDLALPAEIVEGRATQITVHGDWKSIELPSRRAETCSRSFGVRGPGNVLIAT